MTDRVFQDDRCFEVSSGGRDVEFYVFDPEFTDMHGSAASDVMVSASEGGGWDSQSASFTMTAEEATKLKEFLIVKGY